MAVNAKPRREYAGHQEEYQKQDVEHGKHPLHPGNPGSQLRCCLPSTMRSQLFDVQQQIANQPSRNLNYESMTRGLSC